jgi:hypothetical protein
MFMQPASKNHNVSRQQELFHNTSRTGDSSKILFGMPFLGADWEA